MSKCLAIIPARGGSKRIPYKNIKEFYGQPIIKYSIDAAIKSKCFNEIMVSTDDTKIAEVAINCGAKVPFYRSAKNSDDNAMLADVVEEVIWRYQKEGKNFEFFCCILPTAPFIKVSNLLYTFEILKKNSVDAVVPVVRFGYPIQRALKIERGNLEMMWPENLNKRSQDLMPAYHDCGQFYWMSVKSFLEQKNLFAKNTLAIELPEFEVQDIDTLQDWILAESKFRIINEKSL